MQKNVVIFRPLSTLRASLTNAYYQDFQEGSNTIGNLTFDAILKDTSILNIYNDHIKFHITRWWAIDNNGFWLE